MLTRLVRPFVRRTGQGSRRAYHGHGDEEVAKLPTYNDLPVPQGSWREAYEKNQKKYNMQLIIGTVFLTVSVIFPSASGLIFFNYYPPPFPEKYREELSRQ